MNRSFLTAVGACLALSGNEAAVAQDAVLPFPDSPEAAYDLGKRFAECGAYFQYVAGVAEQAKKPESQEWAQGVARGWRASGLIFLLEGLDPGAQAKAVSIFDTLVELKLTEFRSRAEVAPEDAMATIRAEYDHDCVPLVPTQEAMIDILRRNNFGAAE